MDGDCADYVDLVYHRIEREAQEALAAENRALKPQSQHTEANAVHAEIPAAPSTPQKPHEKRKRSATPETPSNEETSGSPDPSASVNEKTTHTQSATTDPPIERARKRSNTTSALKFSTPKKKAMPARNASYSHPTPERTIPKEEIEAWESGPMQKMKAMSEKKVKVVGIEEAMRLDVEAGSPERKKRRRR